MLFHILTVMGFNTPSFQFNLDKLKWEFCYVVVQCCSQEKKKKKLLCISKNKLSKPFISFLLNISTELLFSSFVILRIVVKLFVHVQ